jgi:hypothetical protein
MSRLGHLARRFVGSLSTRPPTDADAVWAESHLLDVEVELWRRMSAVDRRHAITVARRFVAAGEWTRDEVAAALLHDVGKLDSQLGTLARVVATVVGPRGRHFQRYHRHEEIGAAMLSAAGSSAVTVALVRGDGRAAEALRAADEI